MSCCCFWHRVQQSILVTVWINKEGTRYIHTCIHTHMYIKPMKMLRAHSRNLKTTCSHLNAWNVVQLPNNVHRHTGFGADSLEDDSHVLRGIEAKYADHRTDNSYTGCFCRTGRGIDSFQTSPAHLAFLLTLAAHVMLKWPVLKFRKQTAQPQT